MNAYILTLKNREDRSASAKALGFDLAAIGYQVELVTAVDKGHSHWARRVKPHDKGRMKAGMICCADGHLRIYEKIIQSGAPGLVCEDDVELLDADALLELELPDPFHWIQLYKGTWNVPPWQPVGESEQYWQVSWGHWGTVAYFISPEGAQDILERNTPIRYVADVFLKYTWADGNQSRLAYISKRTIFRHRGTLPTRSQKSGKWELRAG